MGLLDGLRGSASGLINQKLQSLGTPLKTVTAVASNFGITTADLSSVSAVTSKLGQILKSYGPNGTAGVGKHVLTNAMGRKDPLLNFCWFAQLPKIGPYKLDWSYIEEFNAPLRSFDNNVQYQRGRDNKYASKQNVSNLSLKCYEDSTGKTQAYLEAWRNLVIGEDGQFNLPVNYKKDITLVILDVSRAISVYTLVYHGCWPVSADAFQLSSGASERLIASQEFSVDSVDVNVRNVAPLDFGQALVSSFSKGGDFPNNLISSITGSDGGLMNAVKGVYSSGTAFLSKTGLFS